MEQPVARSRRRVFPVASPRRRRRLALGLTLADAAREAGISVSTASYIERGLTIFPSDPQAVKRLDAVIARLAKK